MDNLNQNIAADNSNSRPDTQPARNTPPSEMEDIFLQDRRHLISMIAFQHAKERGFVPGKALEDWLRAEAEVNKNAVSQELNP